MDIRVNNITTRVSQESYEEFSEGFLHITTRGFLGRCVTRSYSICKKWYRAWANKDEIVVKSLISDTEFHYPMANIIKWDFSKI